MNRIIGDTSIINRINAARPGDPVVYINLDFLESLPETFEARAVEVRFKKEESFTNVGSAKAPSWYPGTKIMYEIGEARGVSTDDVAGLVPFYTEVDISRMEMSPNPCIMRKHTGYQATKSGRVQQEDGSYRTIVRDHIEDAWIECTGLWDKEELATEGYARTVEQYGKKGYETEWNGKKTWHECKYDTKWKRRVHFNDLLDKAAGKADTKAKCKVIRELACLKTGYTDDDLKESRFIFAKIVKSTNQVKLEAAAHVDAIRHGIKDASASKALFAPPAAPPAPEPEPEVVRNVTPEPDPTPAELATQAAAEQVDVRREMIRVLKTYTDNGIIPADMATGTADLVGWLERTEDAATSKHWTKALSVLAGIEEKLPAEMRISGNIPK
jgi:hypothetical protein